MIPTLCQNYHVLELIGEGSFGKVYKGRKKYTGQVYIGSIFYILKFFCFVFSFIANILLVFSIVLLTDKKLSN